MRPLVPVLEPLAEAQAVRRLECIYECKGCERCLAANLDMGSPRAKKLDCRSLAA